MTSAVDLSRQIRSAELRHNRDTALSSPPWRLRERQNVLLVTGLLFQKQLASSGVPRSLRKQSCASIYTYVHMYICIYTNIHMLIYMYTCIHINLYVYIYIYFYIYMSIHTYLSKWRFRAAAALEAAAWRPTVPGPIRPGPQLPRPLEVDLPWGVCS